MRVDIAGARGTVEDMGGMMEMLTSIEEEDYSAVQVMRADRVFGREHMETAAEMGMRAFDRGRNLARSLGMELLLYAAAERQISRAIEKMGVGPDTDKFAVVTVGRASPDAIIRALGLERDDAVLAWDMSKDAAAFGITPEEIAMVGAGRIPELVLERMALSETER